MSDTLILLPNLLEASFFGSKHTVAIKQPRRENPESGSPTDFFPTSSLHCERD